MPPGQTEKEKQERTSKYPTAVPKEIFISTDPDEAWDMMQHPPEDLDPQLKLIRLDANGKIASIISIMQRTNVGLYYIANETNFSGPRAISEKGWESQGTEWNRSAHERSTNKLIKDLMKKGFRPIMWEDDQGNPQVFTRKFTWEPVPVKLIDATGTFKPWFEK